MSAYGDIIQEIPKHIELSEHIKSQAIGYIQVMLYGKRYYIPITKKDKKLLGVAIVKGKLTIVNYDLFRTAEEFLRLGISALYLQVRDTVGAGIHTQLSQQLNDGLKKMYSDDLFENITGRIDKGMNKPELLPGGKD